MLRTRLLACLVVVLLSPATVTAAEPWPRSLADQPDEQDGPMVHAFYVLAPDEPDLGWDTTGALGDSLVRINDWFASQTGGRRLRLDMVQGRPDVTFFRLAAAPPPSLTVSYEFRAHIVGQLRQAGLLQPTKLNAILYQGPHPTGWTGTGGGFNALYAIDRTTRFGAGDGAFRSSDSLMAHEMVHALGAVPKTAPHHWNQHVDDDPHDLMFSKPGQRSAPPYVLDSGRDDYFGHGQADRWDVGCQFIWDPPPADARLYDGFPLSVRPGSRSVAFVPAELPLLGDPQPIAEGLLMRAINDGRQAAGLAPVAADPRLRRLAHRSLVQWWDGPETPAADGLAQVGYVGKAGLHRYATAIAAGADPVQAAVAHIPGFVGSERVRQLILDPAVTDLGVGVQVIKGRINLGVFTASRPVDVRGLQIGQGPFGTWTVSGELRRRAGDGPAVAYVADASGWGPAIALGDGDWHGFTKSVLAGSRSRLSLVVPSGSGHSSHLLGVVEPSVGGAGSFIVP